MKITNKYYQKYKQKIQKGVRGKYQNLFEEEKHKRLKKAQKRYQNLAEEEKEKKSISIIVNVIKFFPKNKSRSQFII